VAIIPVTDDAGASGGVERATAYGWVVFARSFGLLISDHMARQVLNAVFPLLKAEWSLSDAQLGALSSVVALMVGLLTFPLSLAADRWGRVRSLTLMAVLWSLATLLCATAHSYGLMFFGRLLVGVGEAAYGSVGIAVVIAVFPARMRATLSSAFLAGSVFGQVIGVAVGGQIAATYGWRIAFLAIALSGLALALLYPVVAREGRLGGGGTMRQRPAIDLRALPRQLFGSRAVNFAYLGSGLQLYTTGSLAAWLPSFFNRYHAMPLDQAAQLIAIYLMISGTGMILCGMLSDRMARDNPLAKVSLAVVFAAISGLFLALAFFAPPGIGQLILLAFGVLMVASVAGTSGAMVANLTPSAIHGTAFATLALSNNLLGLAPGPILTGKFADTLGLVEALRLAPLSCLLSAGAFLIARRTYLGDLERARSGSRG
jgi:MFS family permease